MGGGKINSSWFVTFFASVLESDSDYIVFNS